MINKKGKLWLNGDVFVCQADKGSTVLIKLLFLVFVFVSLTPDRIIWGGLSDWLVSKPLGPFLVQ